MIPIGLQLSKWCQLIIYFRSILQLNLRLPLNLACYLRPFEHMKVIPEHLQIKFVLIWQAFTQVYVTSNARKMLKNTNFTICILLLWNDHNGLLWYKGSSYLCGYWHSIIGNHTSITGTNFHLYVRGPFTHIVTLQI